MRITGTRILMALLGLAIAAAIIAAFIPRAVPVEVQAVSLGPLAVDVQEDGRTRIIDRYIVSSPLRGQLQRITLKAGDPVQAGETILAALLPTDPALLDPRVLAENRARVGRAQTALLQAGPILERARAEYEYAAAELDRILTADTRNAVSPQDLEAARLAERVAAQRLDEARFTEQIAAYELELAQAALLSSTPDGQPAEDRPHFPILSPINGRVLRVLQESSMVIEAGTPLLEVGDPARLELVIDVLSRDAVRITPGDDVIIEHWGGPNPLQAQVRLVEPQAFTKVSALGVEEQRVNVIADFVNPYEQRRTLGDEYRVEASIIIWQEESALRVPTSALFRSGDDWAVFVVEDGKAKLRIIELGEQNDRAAQVLSGLAEGDRVILHPSESVRDGVRIRLIEP